jgi:hypothetical protein
MRFGISPWTPSGWIESCLGNHARAFELFQRAGRLSPRDPRGWFIACGMASAHFMNGRYAEAVTWAKTSLMYNSRYAIGLRHLAASLAMQGDIDAAAAVMRRARRAYFMGSHSRPKSSRGGRGSTAFGKSRTVSRRYSHVSRRCIISRISFEGRCLPPAAQWSGYGTEIVLGPCSVQFGRTPDRKRA